jgi:hypothetical protein
MSAGISRSWCHHLAGEGERLFDGHSKVGLDPLQDDVGRVLIRGEKQTVDIFTGFRILKRGISISSIGDSMADSGPFASFEVLDSSK